MSNKKMWQMLIFIECLKKEFGLLEVNMQQVRNARHIPGIKIFYAYQ